MADYVRIEKDGKEIQHGLMSPEEIEGFKKAGYDVVYQHFFSEVKQKRLACIGRRPSPDGGAEAGHGLPQMRRGNGLGPSSGLREAIVYRPELTKDELHNIVAALRYWQCNGQCEPDNRSDDMQEVVCPADGDVTSLDEAGVDELCERLYSLLDDNRGLSE